MSSLERFERYVHTAIETRRDLEDTQGFMPHVVTFEIDGEPFVAASHADLRLLFKYARIAAAMKLIDAAVFAHESIAVEFESNERAREVSADPDLVESIAADWQWGNRSGMFEMLLIEMAQPGVPTLTCVLRYQREPFEVEERQTGAMEGDWLAGLNRLFDPPRGDLASLVELLHDTVRGFTRQARLDSLTNSMRVHGCWVERF